MQSLKHFFKVSFLILLLAGCAVSNKVPGDSGLTPATQSQIGLENTAEVACTCNGLSTSQCGITTIVIIILLLILIILVLTKIKPKLKNQTVISTPGPNQSGSSESLTEAVATLARDLAIREKETQKLHEIIVHKDQKRALARFCSIYETAEFTRRINATNKIDDKEAFNQLILEIESALADLGLEILTIHSGMLIRDLPAGSFTIVGSEDAVNTKDAGTVKEVVSAAIFIKDSSGAYKFISPAKIKVYKL